MTSHTIFLRFSRWYTSHFNHSQIFFQVLQPSLHRTTFLSNPMILSCKRYTGIRPFSIPSTWLHRPIVGPLTLRVSRSLHRFIYIMYFRNLSAFPHAIFTFWTESLSISERFRFPFPTEGIDTNQTLWENWG